LWGDEHEITAVEMNPKIAAIYQDFFPNDKMVVGDAHQYLLDHFQEFDFIWSSPPCPTHSGFNNLNYHKGVKIKYPDMKLYEEIVLLQNWYDKKYCIENVISYYDPLIAPQKVDSHYYWANFYIRPKEKTKRGIRGEDMDFRRSKVGFNFEKFNLTKTFEKKIINNCVEPEMGLHIFNEAFKAEVQSLF